MSFDLWYQSRVSHDDTLPGDGAVVTNATVVTGSTINPLVVWSKDGNAVVPNVPVNKMLVRVQNFDKKFEKMAIIKTRKNQISLKFLY